MSRASFSWKSWKDQSLFTSGRAVRVVALRSTLGIPAKSAQIRYTILVYCYSRWYLLTKFLFNRTTIRSWVLWASSSSRSYRDRPGIGSGNSGRQDGPVIRRHECLVLSSRRVKDPDSFRISCQYCKLTRSLHWHNQWLDLLYIYN